jgi:uncharacterized membrane protein
MSRSAWRYTTVGVPGPAYLPMLSTRYPSTKVAWRLMGSNRDPMMSGSSKSLWHKHPGVRSDNELSFGERAADKMRNGMGSWAFIFTFLFVMLAWMGFNTFVLERVVHHRQIDAYPYILLNLMLSTLAGLQAAALLIAAKRADSISSEVALHTEHTADEIKALLDENTQLTNQVKRNTDVLDEIHLHVGKIAKTVGVPLGNFSPPNEAAAQDGSAERAPNKAS